MIQDLNVKAWAITGAIILGIYVFLATLFETWGITLFWFNSEVFVFLTSLYPGVSATIGGAFFGLVTGAICGAFCAGLFSSVHNWASKQFK